MALKPKEYEEGGTNLVSKIWEKKKKISMAIIKKENPQLGNTPQVTKGGKREGGHTWSKRGEQTISIKD